MKILHFFAAAGNPKVAPPLAGQAASTLRPFSRFLGQAIHTAKQRQTRYQLPWEKVRDLITLRLDPIDTLMRVPRRLPGTVLVDWPSGKAPDFDQQGFVVNRGVPFRVEEAIPGPAGLQVRTDVALHPNDSVIWCGVNGTIQNEAAPPPPREVMDVQGRPLVLAAPPREGENGFWLLSVEGKHADCDLMVDGDEVEADVLRIPDLRRVVDQQGRRFDVMSGMLRVEETPADGLLQGDNGIRYRWSEDGKSGRRGNWIQLLPPAASEADDFMDARAAFCEGDVKEIWTQPRHSPSTTFKVKKVDQDRYQLLLDRYPPEGSALYLPVNMRNLNLQKRALRQLSEAPLPHHQGLLRLCEDPQKVRWPSVRQVEIGDDGWRALTDASRSGTDEQRAFVSKALGTPDIAILEGPPGSGKTTAICEIIQQLVDSGQRVLLCASTNVAIDNVLERLLDSESAVDAVRIGRPDKVDDKVLATQLDARVESLMAAWRGQPAMGKYGADLADMAERTVIMASNLTCGTTMGIVSHPLFQGRDQDANHWERPITSMPHWDVLIVDEASKTLIQEFLVPALMAKRWIIVGDVRQLPPFADRADIVANLRDLVNDRSQPVFPADHQRACLLLFRLGRSLVRQPGMRWLLAERPGVLEWVARELESRTEQGPSVVRIAATPGRSTGRVPVVTVEQLRAGAPEALLVAAADWVLVGDDLLGRVADLLPANLLHAKDVTDRNGANLDEGNVHLLRQAHWLATARSLPLSYSDKQFRRESVATYAASQICEASWLNKNDLAQELAWRLTRLHELRHSRNERERSRLRADLERLQPVAVSIKEPLGEIADIGLPSILEVLQTGIGEDRANRRSSLTAGLKATQPRAFDARFESLSYQHRMHPQIADFSRDIIYEGQALKDANTIQKRDAELGWDFGSFPARRVWANIDGREQGGVNADEVQAMAALLRNFIAWAKTKGPPHRDLPDVWEVACLCFYVKQERAISEMLRSLTQDDRKTRFRVPGAPVEVVCATVDRFQGREADLVMLSMRNTQRVGFLDSPNRLNVAVTRARQQLVVFGKSAYYRDCNVSELEELAKRTPLMAEKEVDKRRRSVR